MIILRFSLLAAVSASFFVSQVSKASAAKTPARLAPEIELSVRDVCYAYVDPSSKNRCEAIKTCIPRGEKILKGEIEKAKN